MSREKAWLLVRPYQRGREAEAVSGVLLAVSPFKGCCETLTLTHKGRLSGRLQVSQKTCPVTIWNTNLYLTQYGLHQKAAKLRVWNPHALDGLRQPRGQ